MQNFGKRNPLNVSHFKEVESCFGSNPMGMSRRQEGNEMSRWRKLTRDEISTQHSDRLDWTWLHEERETDNDEVLGSDAILKEIGENLDTVSNIFRKLSIDLIRKSK